MECFVGIGVVGGCQFFGTIAGDDFQYSHSPADIIAYKPHPPSAIRQKRRIIRRLRIMHEAIALGVQRFTFQVRTDELLQARDAMRIQPRQLPHGKITIFYIVQGFGNLRPAGASLWEGIGVWKIGLKIQNRRSIQQVVRLDIYFKSFNIN